MKNSIKEINTISLDGHSYSLVIPSVSIIGLALMSVLIYTITDAISFHSYSRVIIPTSHPKEADISKHLLCGTLVVIRSIVWRYRPREHGLCFFVDGSTVNGDFG